MGGIVRQDCPTLGVDRWTTGWTNLSYTPAHVGFY